MKKAETRATTLGLLFCLIQFAMTATAIADDVTSRDKTAAFVGTWNYDQPNYKLNVNIARISCPKEKNPPDQTLLVPQIGSIAMVRTGEAKLLGTTDQGCNWTFVTDGKTAHLDGPQKSCFNKYIQLSYTITKWDISLARARWNEVITADSHNPMGTCESVMAKGPRSRVVSNAKRDDAKKFVGKWTYEPTDAVTQKSTALATCPGSKARTPVLLRGAMSIEETGPHSISAINESGCALKFDVQGNTAALNPPTQICKNAPKGTPKSYDFWTMASDGKELFEFGSGLIAGEQGDCFLSATQGVRTLDLDPHSRASY